MMYESYMTYSIGKFVECCTVYSWSVNGLPRLEVRVSNQISMDALSKPG